MHIRLTFPYKIDPFCNFNSELFSESMFTNAFDLVKVYESNRIEEMGKT